MTFKRLVGSSCESFAQCFPNSVDAQNPRYFSKFIHCFHNFIHVYGTWIFEKY